MVFPWFPMISYGFPMVSYDFLWFETNSKIGNSWEFETENLVLKQLSCKTLENESREDLVNLVNLATSHFGRFLKGRKARFHLGNSVSYMAYRAPNLSG